MSTAFPRKPRIPALLLVAALTALVATWLVPAPAYACSCVKSSDTELAQRAAVIFTGTITADVVDHSAQTRTLTFAVDRVYKGQARATQTVSSHSSGASCGLEIGGSGAFLVFANQKSSELTANLCGGTRSGTAPASLGTGRPPLPDPTSPTPAPPGPPAGTGLWVPRVGLVLAAAAAAVVGLALFGQRRQ